MAIRHDSGWYKKLASGKVDHIRNQVNNIGYMDKAGRPTCNSYHIQPASTSRPTTEGRVRGDSNKNQQTHSVPTRRLPEGQYCVERLISKRKKVCVPYIIAIYVYSVTEQFTGIKCIYIAKYLCVNGLYSCLCYSGV